MCVVCSWHILSISHLLDNVSGMKRIILLLILAIFGVFVYFAAFRNVIIWPLMLPLLVLVVVYYVISSVVTRKMVEKVRKVDSFYFIRANMIPRDGKELIGGALTVTPSEIIFYSRLSAKGGVKPIWSCFTPEVEGYTMKKVDDFHPGISFAIKGETDEIRFTSRRIAKEEKEFRKALGWPEEESKNLD